MAYTTINKSSDYFNTKLYTGTGSSNAITGVGFQPDFTWIKNRATTGNHALFDVINGVTKYVNSNTNYALQTSAQTLTAFGTDGFTVGTSADLNGNGNNVASWNWKAGGGQGSSNTDGSINTTYTSVSTTSGLSISKYTGTGSNATVGHGLGVAPKMILIKRLSAGDNWIVYHNSLGGTKNLYLDATNAEDTRSDTFNNTAPTSSVFSLGSATGTNGSGSTYVAYCFAEKTGYSKFGSYSANNNADGNFLYTGFKPAFTIFKKTNAAGSWWIHDNKTSPYNLATNTMTANTNGAETTGVGVQDLVSNGIKLRGTTDATNGSGGTYIYMAFGQSLVGSNNIPCTAR
jgi:hypothetical protein